MDIIYSYKSDSQVEDYQATLERLEVALLTQKGSVSADPNFGFNVSGIIDHQLSSELLLTIKAELLLLMATYFPDIQLIDLSINKTGDTVLQLILTVRIMTSNKTLKTAVELS